MNPIIQVTMFLVPCHLCKDRSFFCKIQTLEQRNQEKVHFFYVESLVNSPIVSDFLASF